MHFLRPLSAALALLITCFTFPLSAAQPERVIVDSFEEFEAGNSKSVSLDERGFLRKAPEVKQLKNVSAGQVWDMLVDPDGSYLLGTSPDGELLRITRTGQKEIVTKFKEKQVTALVRNAEGELFAATSPDGKVYRIPANGRPEVWFDPKEKYIWDLLVAEDGSLFVATGTNGKIYRVTGQGRGTVYYDSEETHIYTLAQNPKSKHLLAGSGDSGYLYRVTAEGQAVVLFSNGEKQINNILVDQDGVIFFTALGGSKPKPPPSSASSRMANLRQIMAAANAARGNPNGKMPPKPSGAPPSSGGKSPNGQASKVYRLGESLFAEAIWSTQATIFTMLEVEGKLFLGTGDEGYLYELTKEGDATLLLQVEGQTISAAAPVGTKQFALATSNPIKVFIAGGPRAGLGIYESEVFDSELFARWGAVRAKAEGPVKIRTRSGNTPEPDKSWYPWSDLGSQSQSTSPAARFFQIELQIGDGEVDRFEFVYLLRNLPPRVQEVKLLPIGIGFQAIMPPPQPPTPRTAEQLLKIEEDDDPESLKRRIDVRFQPQLARGLRTAVWQANDPNGDALRYNVFYREDNDTDWHLLSKELEEPVISWDSTGWPDGNYYLKVEATDAEDNAPEDRQSHSKISKLITVDNTAPVITVNSVSGGEVKFTVVDAASMIASIQVSRNGYDYKPLRPEDGILDGQRESFIASLKAGEMLFIRAEDEAGNVSSAQARGK